MVDRSLSWIGYFPPAVDLANTIIDSPAGMVDLLATDADLEAWIAAESAQLPLAQAAEGHLADVQVLRDAVRATLFAAVADRRVPAAALEAVNAAAAAVPTHPRLRADATRELVETSGDAFRRFLATVARSVIELLAGDERARLSVCGAPSCGMFFLRDDPRQRWCTSSCGNRARVARHAARTPRRNRRSSAPR